VSLSPKPSFLNLRVSEDSSLKSLHKAVELVIKLKVFFFAFSGPVLVDEVITSIFHVIKDWLLESI